MDPLVKKALDCVDLNGLTDILIDDVIEAAILKAVAKSENKIDDAVAGIIIPLAKAEGKKYLKEKIAELKA